MRHVRAIFITFIIIILPICKTFGQHYLFENINTSEGLSHVTVNDIYQDMVGRMWFGTQNGLNCYDGNVIKVFKLTGKESSNSLIRTIVGDDNKCLYLRARSSFIEFDLETEEFKTIIDKRVSAISKGKDCIWICLENSIYKYNLQDKSLQHIVDTKGLEEQAFYCILEDRNGLCWIGTSFGLYALENRTLKIVYQNVPVKHIYEDSKHNLWFSTLGNGLIKKDTSGNEITFNKENGLISNFVRCVCEDDLGNIWIGSQFGLSVFNIKKNNVDNYFSDTSSPNSLTSRSITALCKDKQGTIWIATYFGGINYTNPRTQTFQYFPAEKGGLSYPVVGKMTEDKNGVIWMGTEGNGLVSYNPEENSFTSYNTSTYNYTNQNIKEILYDQERDCLWLGFPENGLDMFDLKTQKNTKYKHQLKNLKLSRFESKLLVGSSQRLALFDPNNPLKEVETFPNKQKFELEPTILSLLYDSKKRVWFGTDQGLYMYDCQTDILRIYKHNASDSSSISGNAITAIKEDDKNRIWFASTGSGLNEYQPKTDSFKRYNNNSHGIQDDYISAIAVSHMGNILLGTSRGFSILNPESGGVVNYNKNNGFPLTMVNDNSIYVSKNGDIYIGGVTGITIFREDQLQENDIKPSNIWFSQLFVNNEEVKYFNEKDSLRRMFSFCEEVELKYDYNMFSIHVATDNYINSNKIHLEYRLKNYNDNWLTLQNKLPLSYTSLAPDEYILEVRIKEYPEIFTALTIEIQPPFYKTWYAYSLYIIVILTILLVIYKQAQSRFYLKTLLDFEKREKERVQILAQNKIDFFTNISHELNTPLTMIVAQVDTLLKKHNLSATVKNKIVSIYKNTNNLKKLVGEIIEFRKQDEIKLNRNRVSLNDFIKNIHLSFSEYAIDNGIDFRCIFTEKNIIVWIDIRSLEKAINNILSNAFKFSRSGSAVTIEIRVDNDNFSIVISDTGIGIAPDQLNEIFEQFYQVEGVSQIYGGFGIGLAFSKKIIEAHGGTIYAQNREEGIGAIFTIGIPIEQPDLTKSEMQNKEDLADLLITDTNQFTVNTDIISVNEEAEMKSGVSNNNDNFPKLLIVEDNQELAGLLSSTFSQFYNVSVTYDGDDGLKTARELLPDLIISDVMMPGISGVELCRIIKENIDTSHIPIVLLTARSSGIHKLEGLQVGADDYITKPFDIHLLLARCNNLLNNRKLLQKKYLLEVDSTPQMIATNTLDLELLNKATEIVLNNIDNNKFNVDLFAEEIGMSRTSLYNKLKGISGLTPNIFIQNIKLKKASEMLLNNPELTVSEIGYILGFETPKYFASRFKSIFAYTPSAYREKNKPKL